MGKHDHKHSALENVQRAPDPFPIFKRAGTPDGLNELDCNIECIADGLIADLRRAQRTTARARSPKLRPTLKPEDARFLTYALIVHRTRHGGVLSEAHLRLLHAVLGIQRLSLRAAEAAGMPAVKDFAAFVSAADLEAREPTISENRLARGVGVDRKTIRAWRKMKEFGEHVRATRYFEGNATEEDRKIKESWVKAMGRRTRGVTS